MLRPRAIISAALSSRNISAPRLAATASYHDSRCSAAKYRDGYTEHHYTRLMSPLYSSPSTRRYLLWINNSHLLGASTAGDTTHTNAFSLRFNPTPCVSTFFSRQCHVLVCFDICDLPTISSPPTATPNAQRPLRRVSYCACHRLVV